MSDQNNPEIATLTLGQTPPLGPLPTAVMLLKFPDSDHEPFGDVLMQHEVFDTYGDWISRCSYGRASLARTGIFGWAMMPHSHAEYASGQFGFSNYFKNPNGYWYGQPPSAMFDHAATITRTFCDFYQQRLVVNMFTGWGPTMGMGGGGVVNCSAEYKQEARPLLDVLTHEGGHALGRLVHAGSVHESQGPGEIPPNLDDLNDGGFYATRYGDNLDAMGNGGAQFSAHHKHLCGWIDESKVKVVAEGTVMLADVDGAYPPGAAALEMLIPLDVKGHAYSLERRSGGVIARLVCPSPQMAGTGQVDIDTALLRNGAPLVQGTPFVDKYRGVSMTLVADVRGFSFVKVSRT